MISCSVTISHINMKPLSNVPQTVSISNTCSRCNDCRGSLFCLCPDSMLQMSSLAQQRNSGFESNCSHICLSACLCFLLMSRVSSGLATSRCSAQEVLPILDKTYTVKIDFEWEQATGPNAPGYNKNRMLSPERAREI
jgi:hypothetical protein